MSFLFFIPYDNVMVVMDRYQVVNLNGDDLKPLNCLNGTFAFSINENYQGNSRHIKVLSTGHLSLIGSDHIVYIWDYHKVENTAIKIHTSKC